MIFLDLSCCKKTFLQYSPSALFAHIWARIWQKVPYGYINQNQTYDAFAKYYLLRAFFWKYEAIIFKIDEYMEVLISVCNQVLNRDVKNNVKPNMTSNAGFQLLVNHSRLGITI